MNILFVWGAGGVGKSHLAIRRAATRDHSSLLITLDPSQRVFDLLSVSRNEFSAKVQLDDLSFTIKQADQNKLFEALESKKPAGAKVRSFYDQMVKGLQDFRDYLTLIQLSEELTKINQFEEKSSPEFTNVVIDTPPFQEAMGLHRSLFNLRHFFEKSLVQLALKSTSISWFHAPLKKVFEVARIFSGKKTAEQIFDFIEWLTHHTEKFSLSAKYLEELVFSKQTRHLFVLTPETPFRFLDEVEAFFKKSSRIEFVINRSVAHFQLPDLQDSFIDEIHSLQLLEESLMNKIQKQFRSSQIERIPLMLMGEDSKTELLKFIRTKGK